MPASLHVLILEDRAEDAELMLYEIRRAGFALAWRRVETEDTYLAELHRSPDIILADYTLPQFNALRALHLLQEQNLDIPFIIVTGTTSEEVAVECMKQGAADYLLKDRLTRLGPAVTRALDEKRLHDAKRRTDVALRESEAGFRLLAENSTDMISRHTAEGVFVYVSPACRTLLGYTPEEMLGRSIYEFFHSEELAAAAEMHAGILQTPNIYTATRRVRRKDGAYLWLETTLRGVHDLLTGAVAEIHASSRDITARKRAEEALQEDAEVSASLERVGRELIAALGTPRILDRLCRRTTEALAGHSCLIALWQPQTQVFVIVANWGYTVEQAEALRVLQIPEAGIQCLSTLLQQHDIASTEEQIPVELQSLLPEQHQTGALLSLALRHGTQLMGLQICGYPAGKTPTSAHRRIAQGISQVASLALASARLIQELERANRLKSDFLATMSHELRTPVNVVLGYAELLLDGEYGPLVPEQREVLKRVKKSSQELLELILSTLDVSRLEAGKLPMDVGEVQLPALMSEVADETQDLMRNNPALHFSWQAADTLPPLYTDRAKLKVVLKNLVHNAVKFTEKGNVIAKATLDDDGITVSVTDTGIGIAPDVLPHIFDMFRQGDSSSTRRYGGVGLGLYIVRRLLEVLGGNISVESKIGLGSTFRVWLPLPRSSRDQHNARSPASS